MPKPVKRYTILFMHSVIGLIVFIAIFLAPVGVSAQNVLQSGGTNQQQTGATQNTQQLQNNTAPLQPNNNSSPLAQNQPQTLGVVSSPNQTNPSVVVGAADTTNQTVEIGGGINYYLIGLITVVCLATVIGLWTYRHTTAEEIEEAVLLAETPAAKPKKASKKRSNSAVKKKKKKAHR